MNIDTNETVLESTGVSRRAALRTSGRLGTAGLALAAAPLGVVAAARKLGAMQAQVSVQDVLNFALLLEYLEAEYYVRGVDSGVIPGQDRRTFRTIRDHELVHVAFLRNALGSAAIPEPEFDFTAGGQFAPFSDYPTFLLLAQGFEDTGVRAYKGQLPNLQSAPAVLTAAATIHSVEGEHASKVRRIRGLEGWIPDSGDDSPAVLAAVYAGEGNTVQGGVDLASAGFAAFGITVEQIQEAFDEPLTMEEVLAIAGMFLA
ncbi:MAG: ferritin-like domain-containing protein [Gemmatimonadota bacterium]|jgi:hypothetical protein